MNHPIHLPKAILSPLVQRFSLPVSPLGRFFIPDTSGTNLLGMAASWFDGKTPEEQGRIQLYLKTLAAPPCIAQIHFLRDHNRLVKTYAMPHQTLAESQWILAGRDDLAKEFLVNSVPSSASLCHSMLANLEPDIPVWEGQLTIKMALPDWIVLCGLADLYSRIHYAAWLEHRPVDEEFALADICRSVDDGLTYQDPRWLLPFFLPLMPVKIDRLSPELIRTSLQNLVGLGLLADLTRRDTVHLSEAGLLLVSSLHERTSAVAFHLTSQNADQSLQNLMEFFVRSRRLLWFMDIFGEGDEVKVSLISLETAEKLLGELLNPAALNASLYETSPLQPVPQVITPWKLIYEEGPQKGTAFILLPSTHIGRSVNNDLRLQNTQISRSHALIELKDGSYILTDLGSANGSYLNGVRITEPTPIHHNDLIRFMDLQFRVQDPAAPPSPAVPPLPPATPPPALQVPVVRVITPPEPAPQPPVRETIDLSNAAPPPQPRVISNTIPISDLASMAPPQEVICPKCKKPQRTDSHFCRFCGCKLQ
ncbi:MAG TPA: FHA domain-containing protein [Anaerolineaceae bacterium]|nr:FHA domain-containing protein [Anaerolineaceae bacterium]HPN51173.1 FHA domain-containing protein [Anaerolineaceae bacterium]